jgi:hypothetical protein
MVPRACSMAAVNWPLHYFLDEGFKGKALQIVFGPVNCTVSQCPGKGPVGGYYDFSAINNCFSLANYNNLLRCERCSFSTMDLDSDYYSWM